MYFLSAYLSKMTGRLSGNRKVARGKGKILCIGLPKTGTTSLSRALEILGYSSIHYPTKINQIDDYDSASDSLVAVNFKELDKRYPGSRFILTTRDEQEWLDSLKKHMRRLNVPKKGTPSYQLRVDSIGAATYNEAAHKRARQNHLKAVKKYFKDRPEDLLTLDISQHVGWSSLCQFLQKPIPDQPFPMANVASQDTLRDIAKNKNPL